MLTQNAQNKMNEQGKLGAGIGRLAGKWTRAIGLLAVAGMGLVGTNLPAYAATASSWSDWVSVDSGHPDLKARFRVDKDSCTADSCPVQVQFRNGYDKTVFFTEDVTYTDSDGNEQVAEESFRLNPGDRTNEDECVIDMKSLGDVEITEFAVAD